MLQTIFIVVSLAYVSHALKCQNTDKIQMVAGSMIGEGKLEVKGSSGNWGSVCPDKWSATNAAVACDELCGTRKYSSSVPARELFGDIKPITFFDTKCSGPEDSLTKCRQVENTTGSCWDDSGVGLCCHQGCSGRNMFLAPKLRYKVTCNWNSYTVYTEYPEQNNPTNAFKLYPLPNPACTSQSTGATNKHNWLTVKYGNGSDCGTYIEIEEHTYKYKQTVLINIAKTEKGITRLFQWLLPVSCAVNSKTNASEWIGTNPEIGIIENRTEEENKLQFTMSIKVFSDPNFSKELAKPALLAVGEPMFIQLEVDRASLQAAGTSKILVADCHAKPYENANAGQLYPVILNRSADDEGTIIIRSPNFHQVRFRMQTFMLGSTHKQLYLACSAYVCPSQDRSGKCTDPTALLQHEHNATAFESTQFAESAPALAKLSIKTEGFTLKKPVFRAGRLGQDECPTIGPNDFVRVDVNNKLYWFKIDDNDQIITIKVLANDKCPNARRR